MITVHCNTINNTYGEAIQQLEQKTNAFRKSVEHLRTLYGDLLEDIESGKRFTKLEQWHTARETFESLRESEGYDFVPPEDRKPYEDNYKKILKEGNEAHDSYMEKLGTDRINEAVDEMNKATERFEKQAIDLASTIERHKKNANEKNMTAERYLKYIKLEQKASKRGMPLEDYKKMKLHKKSYKLGISPYEYRTHKVREKAHRNDMRYGEYIESRMREEANRQNISVDNLKRKIMDDEEMNMSSSDIEVHSENEHILGYESISDSSTSSSGEESDVPNEEEH